MLKFSRKPITQLMPLGAILLFASFLYVMFLRNALGRVDGRRQFVLFDDAMISMRYAQNLAEGHGLVWNAGGEHVEGYTNLLWTLWMTVLHLVLPARFVAAGVIATSFLLLLVGIVLAYKLAQRLLPNNVVAPLVAAFLTAVCYPLTLWSLRGMEVGLISVLFTATLLVACSAIESPTKKHLLTIAALASLGLLTRPDTAVVSVATIALLLLFVKKAHRKHVLIYSVVPFLITAVALSAFRVGYYHSLVPNTYVLKIEHYALRIRLRRGVLALLEVLGKGGLGVCFALGAVALIRGTRQQQKRLLVVAAAVLSVFAYSIYVGGDAWEGIHTPNRYLSAVLPALFTLVGVGIARLVETVRFSKSKLSPVVSLTALVATFLLAIVALPRMDATSTTPNTFSDWLKWSLIACIVIVALTMFVKVNKLVAATSATILVIAIVCATEGRNLQYWSNDVVARGTNDYAWANYGSALRRFTKPGTTIVVAAAGNTAYFAGSDRIAYDSLGKADSVVAHQLPKLPYNPPGHQKWSHEHTVGELQPDVVSQQFNRTLEDVNKIISYGYDPVSWAYVRKDSTNVDRVGLNNWLLANPQL